MRLAPVHSGHKWLNQPQLERYNLLDCVATASIIAPMLEELRDHGMEAFWREEVWPLVPAVIGMQARGLLVDRAAKAALRRRIRAELAVVDEAILAADTSGELSKPTGKYPHGLNANNRVATFLYERLGLKVPKRTEGGKPSVDQESLVRLWRDLRKKDEHARGVLGDLFHRTKLQTMDERYLEFYIHEDGRVRPSVKMIGTETLRFAYSDPPLQQVTPEIRAMFPPSEGCVFVAVDYSQLEARIQAHLAQVRRDLAILESGEDLHALTAQEIFELDPHQWGDLDPAQAKGMRNYAKSFRYRLAYGGDPAQVGKLGARVFCPCPRCRKPEDVEVNLPPGTITRAGQRFLGNRPEIAAWREARLREVRDTRCLTVVGRKRYFFGPLASVKREVFNFPIQFLAAWRINRAMRGLDALGAPIVMQVHDSLMVECPREEAGHWRDVMREQMEDRVDELGGVEFPVDVEVQAPWGVECERAT